MRCGESTTSTSRPTAPPWQKKFHQWKTCLHSAACGGASETICCCRAAWWSAREKKLSRDEVKERLIKSEALLGATSNFHSKRFHRRRCEISKADCKRKMETTIYIKQQNAKRPEEKEKNRRKLKLFTYIFKFTTRRKTWRLEICKSAACLSPLAVQWLLARNTRILNGINRLD